MHYVINDKFVTLIRWNTWIPSRADSAKKNYRTHNICEGSELETNYLEYAGHRLAVHTAGNDNRITCVFVHGGPGGRSPVDFGELLAKYFRIVMYDQFGGGDSDPYDGISDLDAQYYLDEIHNLIPRIVRGPYVIIGYSWGAALAVSYASECKDADLLGVVLISPFLSGPVWTSDQIAILRTISPPMAEDMERYVRTEYVGKEAMDILAVLFEKTLFMKEENRRNSHRFAHIPIARVCLRLWGKNDGIPIGPLKDFDITEHLRKVRVPTLILYGSSDQVTDRAVNSYLELLPHGSRRSIFSAGHYTITEEPELYLEQILGFIDSIE